MVESLLSQLMSRGEEFFTQVSNSLMANPAFIEMLKKGIAAKEAMDEQAAAAMKRMNVATRKDVRSLEKRIDALEAKIDALSAAKANASARAKARPAPRRRKPAGE